MEKSLIEIPDFNPGSVLYLTEVTRYKYFKDIKHVHIKKNMDVEKGNQLVLLDINK